MPEPVQTTPAPDPQPQDPAPAQDPAPSPLDQRLASIINTQKETERRVDDTAAQNEALVAKIAELVHKVDSMKREPAPAAPQPSANPSIYEPPLHDAPSGSNVTPSTNELQQIVSQTIEQQLGPVVQEIQQSRAQGALVADQNASFERAATHMPDLTNPQSQHREAFNRIWNARADLQGLADGPAIVAEMAKGVIADLRRDEALARERKSNASIVNRSTSAIFRPESEQEKTEVKNLLDKVVEKGTTRGLSPKETEDYLKLKLANAFGEAK